MKYGIVVNGRVTEPVAIPDPLPFGGDAAGFLAVMFPGKSGWVEVPDDAVPGTIANGDGSFTTQEITFSAPGGGSSGESLILERLSDLSDKLAAVEAKVDALAP